MSSVHRVAGVALAVGAAGALIPTRALAVDAISAAFVGVGITGGAFAVWPALTVVTAVALSRTG